MDPGFRYAVLGAVALVAAGCGSDAAPAPERPAIAEPPPVEAPPPSVSTEAASEPSSAAAEEQEGPRLPPAPDPPTGPRPLEVEGYNPASHVGPDDPIDRPWPVTIVLHGNFDRPEWECDTWKEVAGFHGWILCPRGIRTPWATLAEDRWTYRGSVATAAEIEAALRALESRYPARVTREEAVLVGFSLGANLAPAIARDNPGVYPYVVLVEGGGRSLERPWIARMKKAGVRAVGLAMSLPGLRSKAIAALPRFERAGIRAVFVDMKGAGHAYRDDFPITGRSALGQLLGHQGAADAGPPGEGG